MARTILIVDDNEFNVEIINQLIQKYSKDKQYPINILIANNGQEAVDLCNIKNVDLIFMDLMMPIMDGSEATKLIKKQHPNIIVIVVSALGDEIKQKNMLLNGAEDYIIKPLISCVFKSRLHNYLQLIQHRNHISTTPKAQNLFTSKVYSYHMDFGILSEEDLSEFWEAMLIRLNFVQKVENINDFVRFLYGLGTLQLKQKFKFRIIIEEDIENFYFTINNMQLIGCERIDKLINLYFTGAIYTCKNNKLSFLLQKQSNKEVCDMDEKNEKSIINIEPLKQVEPIQLQTFDILDDEELSNLEEYLIKINSIILLMENSNLDNEEILNLCTYLHSIASILSIANDTYLISDALNKLSISISQNIDYFNESSSILFEFTSAFINDLLFWKTKIFYEGAPSVDFLNDSITTNANMLNALLKQEEDSNDNLDDIFDF